MRCAMIAGMFWLTFVSMLWRLPASTDSLPDKPGGETTEVLIGKLGSNRFQEREEASRRLLAREEAIPALRMALQSKDAEVVRRLVSILEKFEQRRIRRLLDRLNTLVERGVVDQFAEVVAQWPKGFQEEPCRQATCKLARTLEKLHQQQGGKPIELFFLEDKARLLDVVVGEKIHDIPRGGRLFFCGDPIFA